MRTAFYTNQTDADTYFDQIPYRVFRMEWNQEEPTLFKKQPLVKRKTGQTESSHIGVKPDDIIEAMVYVGANVVKHTIDSHSNINTQDWNVQITGTEAGTPDNGFDCIDHGIMCLADCRDTVYPFSMEIYDRAIFCETMNDQQDCYGLTDGLLTDDETDVLYVIGMNHALTNMSSYASMSVYDGDTFWGVNGIGDTQMDNTVWNYLRPDESPTPGIEKTLPYLYVMEIRRNCTTPNCLEVPSSATKSFTTGFIPLKDIVVLTERMYNHPDTHVGPDPSEVVLPIAIHMRGGFVFAKRKRIE